MLLFVCSRPRVPVQTHQAEPHGSHYVYELGQDNLVMSGDSGWGLHRWGCLGKVNLLPASLSLAPFAHQSNPGLPHLADIDLRQHRTGDPCLNTHCALGCGCSDAAWWAAQIHRGRGERRWAGESAPAQPSYPSTKAMSHEVFYRK